MYKRGWVVRKKKSYFILMVGLLMIFIVTACSGAEIEPQLNRIDKPDLMVSSGDVPEKPVPILEKEDPQRSPATGAGNDQGIIDAPDDISESTIEAVQPSEGDGSNAQVSEIMPSEKALPTPDPALASLPEGVQIGYLAPDFNLQTTDGQTIRLSELRGRPVVISYWASWCAPCKNEMQILQGVYQQYQDIGFTVVAVNAIGQDSMNDVVSMVSELGVTYPVVLDHGDEFAKEYNALFFPTSYFVDANGVIQDIALGDSPEEVFQARVKKFLAQ